MSEALSAATVRTERLDPDPAEALAGLLGAEPPLDRLPPLWHAVYLLERPRQEDLGTDGHVRSSVPPSDGAPLSRMFAGGSVTVLGPLLLGETAARETRTIRREQKQGSSGPLTFVTIEHRLLQRGGVRVVDEQVLVYRHADRPPRDDGGTQTRPSATPADAAPTVPDAAAVSVHCDVTLMFRFSALTYNAHRIHYDRDFARAEGYPDLVVQGPLQAILLAEALRRRGDEFDGRRFTYRLVRPAFVGQTLTTAPLTPPGAESASAARAELRTEASDVTATATLEQAR